MAINLNDKTNKSIAALASKIMQEQPTKVRDFTDTKPIESDMVQRVMNTGLKGNFIKEDTKQLDEVKAVVKAHGDKPATHAVYMTQHPTAAAGWRGPSRTLEVHVHAKDNEHAKELATKATANHGTGGWEKPFVPSNPLWQPVKALKEDPEQLDEIGDTPKGKEVLKNYISAAAKSVHNKAYRAGKTEGSTGTFDAPHIVGSIKRQIGIQRATQRLAKEDIEQHSKSQIKEDAVGNVIKHLTHHGYDKDDSETGTPITKSHEDAMKKKPTHKFEDRYGNTHKVWHTGTGNSAETIHHFHDEEAGHDSPSVYKGHHSVANLKKLANMSESINEARFGKAIDPSKLSKEARARLAARDAAKAPVKSDSKLGSIAASFKKPEEKKEEPKAEAPKPAAKPENKFTELRRKNMERMKAHQAAVASGKVGGGGEQRSGGKLGTPGDVEKKGTEIKGDRGAEHAARTGEKDAGSVVSGTTKPQSERNKRKKGPESDEHDDVHEALKGNQHKIDANHNGRIDGQDFKLLRKKHKKGQ